MTALKKNKHNCRLGRFHRWNATRRAFLLTLFPSWSLSTQLPCFNLAYWFISNNQPYWARDNTSSSWRRQAVWQTLSHQLPHFGITAQSFHIFCRGFCSKMNHYYAVTEGVNTNVIYFAKKAADKFNEIAFSAVKTNCAPSFPLRSHKRTPSLHLINLSKSAAPLMK